MILREIKNIYIKNHLTEGVDFVRKEWLKGDGRAYIDTGITDLSISEYIKFEMDDSNDPAVRCMGCERNTQEGCGRLCFGWQGDSSSGGGTIYMWSDTGTWGANNNRRKWTLDLVNNVAYTGSISKTTGLVFPKKVQSFVLFGVRYASGNVSIKSQCTMWSFEVHNQINLVPCQLLKSIPATLDANKKSRSTGECGMYDSISGKFYGNVASTGTFTVEGDVEPENHSGLQQIYQNRLIEGVDYETYDWLRSTGGSYIELNYTNNGDYNIELKGKELKSTGDDVSLILGPNPAAWILGYFMICIFPSSSKILFEGSDRNFPSAYQEFNIKIVNSTDLTLNDASYTINKKPLKLNSLFFYGYKTTGRLLQGCIGHLKVDNYCNMYPCTLLRSIPRNLDAQCKERAVGECGMIDLISGKFYGNVASSGTFTVENDNNE